MDEIKLKPCPFCGSTDPLIVTFIELPKDAEGREIPLDTKSLYLVRSCATSPTASASEAWNRRSK